MPYVSVHIDASEVLDDLSDEELRAELVRRASRTGSSGSYADYCIPKAAAKSALDDAAQFLRRLERVDLAYKLDEIRTDYLEHETEVIRLPQKGL